MRTIPGPIFFVVFFAPVELAAQAASPIQLASTADLTRQIDEILTDTNTPGMIGAIVSRDGVIWAGGVGVVDRETNDPADSKTIFRLGSITKSLTGLATGRMME